MSKIIVLTADGVRNAYPAREEAESAKQHFQDVNPALAPVIVESADEIKALHDLIGAVQDSWENIDEQAESTPLLTKESARLEKVEAILQKAIEEIKAA